MKLEEQIKVSLNAEQQKLDKVICTNDGLFDRIAGVYQGHMRWWVMLSSVIALLLTVGFIYAGFQFYKAGSVSELVFWAVWFIVGLIMQISIKIWIFMEMNRVTQLKELKRTELVILQAIIMSD